METELNYDVIDDKYFGQIADRLLNECRLIAGKKVLRLIEIEFYLKTNHHNDLYVHGDPDQLLMHTFYFHKYKTGSYKSGTYKGMDLTFGDQNQNAYFGILIRAVQDIKTNKIIEGPCLVVNYILSLCGVESISDLTNGGNMSLIDAKSVLHLELTDQFEREPIAKGPRIGLSTKYPDFQNRPYRYVILKHRISKKKSTLNYI